MRAVVVITCIAALAACKKGKSRAEISCDPGVARTLCNTWSDPYACGWVRALREAGDETAWRALLPQLEGKRIADDVMPAPRPLTMKFRSFAPYEVTVPVDWDADPYHSGTWTLELQGLNWMDSVEDLDSAAAVLVDYVERALSSDPPPAWNWDDAAQVKRLNFVGTFFDRYTASRDVLDRRVVRAVARVAQTHLYALSTNLCYAAHDNHGMMVDTAVLKNVRRYRMPESEEMWDGAEARMVAHTERSVSSDGIQYEHSPEYQILYLDLLLDAIDAIIAGGERPPREVEARRDGMLESTIYLLQPDLTPPQFGDTENSKWRARLVEYTETARRQGADPAVIAHLEWITSRGAKGTPPPELDHVYEVGGYASFRDRWGPDGTTGHMKCNHRGMAHYQRDETTIELFAYGTPVVVDTGKFSYEYASKEWRYQSDVFAHNVLIVDDASYYPPDDPRVFAHGGSGDLMWAQATHAGYESRGIRDQVRTFAFAKPDEFVVIDDVTADGRHRYAQHFHLAPVFTDVRALDDQTVVATGPDAPVVVLAAAAPAQASLEVTEYYPEWGKKLPNTDVVFRQQRDGGSLSFPVVITIAAPGASPRLPDVTTSTDRVRRSTGPTPRP